MPETILEMTDVVAGYHADQLVLNEVSLTAEEGRITAVLGPNGSGKSTTLRVLSGLLRQRSGTIRLRGEEVGGLAVQERLRRGMAYLPQGRSAFPGLTVRENLELGTWPIRRDRVRARRAVETALERFPVLAERREVLAGTMSGGQQQLLEIARMLLVDPSVLLIDEPSVGLSPRLADEVYAQLRALREDGRTIVLVDQNVEAAVEICDHVHLLEFGRNAESGSRADFAGRLGEVIRGWLGGAGSSAEAGADRKEPSA